MAKKKTTKKNQQKLSELLGDNQFLAVCRVGSQFVCKRLSIDGEDLVLEHVGEKGSKWKAMRHFKIEAINLWKKLRN